MSKHKRLIAKVNDVTRVNLGCELRDHGPVGIEELYFAPPNETLPWHLAHVEASLQPATLDDDCPIPNPAGGQGLAFGCSFYGGAARIVLLTDEMPVDFEAPYAFFAVDYQAHVVQYFNLAQISAKIQKTTDAVA